MAKKSSKRGSSKRAVELAMKWQQRADELARVNPGRSKGWIADKIAKEDIGHGYPGHYIKKNIKPVGYI